LLSETGDDLGPFRAGTSQWGEGDRILRGSDKLEVVSVVAAEPEDDLAAYVIVRAVT
jgi:hypothetical protein